MKKTILASLLMIALAITTTTKAQVGIGVSTANINPSAQLDVSSTIKGFLPPRMTAAQRDSIASPAQGLMLYCINCGVKGEPEYYNGAAWVNFMGGGAAAAISLGSSCQGGIVAYIFVSGNPGYVANEIHGLIAATTDQSSGIQWYNGTYNTIGVTGTAIGIGLSNTNKIISILGATSTNYAAGLARAYTGGGYTDWYLPSQNELNMIYLNIGPGAAAPLTNIGSFPSVDYWTSTEYYSKYGAWAQSFGDGSLVAWSKSVTTCYVRAIRTF